MGPIANMHKAIRAVSPGISIALSFVNALLDSTSIFVIMLCNKYCKGNSFLSSMNNIASHQSFQYIKVLKSPIVANEGSDIGTTILKNVLISLDPSILADSIIDSGIAAKKFLISNTFQAETRYGIINAKILPLRCKYLEIKIYHGTSPPLNNNVKNAKKAILFLYFTQFLERGYANIDVISKLSMVPIIVTRMVTMYALSMLDEAESTYL
jgi:hypothetical protein